VITGAIIDINWFDRKLERTCSSDRLGQKSFGQARWRKLKVRLALLDAAPTLADLRAAPGHWHPLGADRAGQWSAALDGSYRLVFEPADEPLPTLPDGGLDPSRVTKVRIIEVVDYHGR
jgi:proteic killer suppression protein